MKKNLPLILVFLFTISSELFAQQEVMYNQYMFNGLAINPAYAGTHESATVTALARKQWTGMRGAPESQLFSVHSPLKNERIGVGIMLAHDKIAITNQTGVYGAYSYKIPFSIGQLSLGLQAGFNSYNSRNSTLILYDEDDQYLINDEVNKFMPNFGTGLYFQTDEFFAGVAVPQILESKYDNDNEAFSSNQKRYYILHTGYVFTASRALKVKPNVMVQAIDADNFEYDINLNFLVKDVVWVGVSNHSLNSLSFLLDLQVTDQFRFGYSFDWATTDIRTVSRGTHEIMLNYNFSFYKDRIITPRYF